MKKLLCVTMLCLSMVLCANCVMGNEPVLIGSFEENAPPLAEAPEITPAGESGLSLDVTVSDDGVITYTYVNNTPETARIIAIPRLEQLFGDESILIPLREDIGFCGTPDHIAANSRSIEWTLDVGYLFDSILDMGTYRLSFSVVDEDYEETGELSADFKIETDGFGFTLLEE